VTAPPRPLVLVTAPSLAAAGLAVLERADCEILFHAGGEDELTEVMCREPIEAVISRTITLNAAAIAGCPTLRVISKHGAGVNNIDVAAATARGVPVFYTPGANGQAVAELAIGMMVAIARDLSLHNRALHGEGWTRAQIGMQLAGRTLGIIGLGAIGTRVARIADALGMSVLVYDPHVRARGYRTCDRLEDFLAHVDVLTLHCPLTAETRGMIGAAELARLKPGSILINTARAEVVDEAALLDALASGHLRGAGLDGFAQEPLPANHPFRRSPRLVLTPHIGGSTEVALDSVSLGAAETAVRLLMGQPVDPALCVNPAILTPATSEPAQ
jgi:D-3-phosphoglycerate dehydrogenase